MTKNALIQELTNHIVSLRRYALVLTRDRQDAEDLVQESLMRAIAAVDSWRRGSDLRAWLFRIMHNLHISNMRRLQVRGSHKQGGSSAEAAEEPSQMLRIEVRNVLAALAELPEAQRQAITLIAIEDLRYEEAAKILDIPMGTLMSRLARGREALRQSMDGRKTPTLHVIRSSR
ncbi:sigma-70 family RNA polymerase sigma factor [Rhodospirillaceae bacterium SYSU D60014]|uniref:sigma-70 family RNA polymerase sigma factor n=1 Tax=Virgifigura deserti TaxID=2268457 RepID=UPI000E66BF8C